VVSPVILPLLRPFDRGLGCRRVHTGAACRTRARRINCGQDLAGFTVALAYHSLTPFGHRSGMSTGEQSSRELSLQRVARTQVHFIEVRSLPESMCCAHYSYLELVHRSSLILIDELKSSVEETMHQNSEEGISTIEPINTSSSNPGDIVRPLGAFEELFCF